MPIGSILGGIAKNVIGKAATSLLGSFFGARAEKASTSARMEALMGHGLTAQEAVGSAGGSGMGGSVINAMLKREELDQQMQIAEKNQELQKRQQDVQAQTARDVANIQGSTARDTAQISAEPGHRRLTEVEVPQVPPKVKKLQNEAATSAPGFVKFLKAMNMSPQNLVASGVYAKYMDQGFDMLDPKSWSKVPVRMRQQAMADILAYGSRIRQEAEGALSLPRKAREQTGRNPIGSGPSVSPFGRVYETGRSMYMHLFGKNPIGKRGSTHYKSN